MHLRQLQLDTAKPSRTVIWTLVRDFRGLRPSPHLSLLYLVVPKSPSGLVNNAISARLKQSKTRFDLDPSDEMGMKFETRSLGYRGGRTSIGDEVVQLVVHEPCLRQRRRKPRGPNLKWICEL